MEPLKIKTPVTKERKGLNFMQTHFPSHEHRMPPPGVVPRPPAGLPPGRKAKVETALPIVRRVLGKKKAREPSPAPVEKRVLLSKKPKTELVPKAGEKGMSYEEYMDRYNSVMAGANQRPYTKKEYTAKYA
jgi:hypothetical protein